MDTNCKHILIVHQGALGDFILSLPAILSLKKHFASKKVYWWGKELHSFWYKHLKIPPLPYKKAKHLIYLFQDKKIPLLEDTLVFWFKISTEAKVTFKLSNLHYLYLVNTQNPLPVKTFLKNQLKSLKIPFYNHWQEELKKSLPPLTSKKILIFPGSGHTAKNWPLKNFLSLAQKLNSLAPTSLVLGPVEQEKLNLNLFKGQDYIILNTLEELIQNLAQAKLVIGNDAGPIHLADLMGIKTLVLFGPTPALIWKPSLAKVITSNLNCAPCSLTANITCPDNKCLQSISWEKVYAQAKSLLT